MDRHFDTPSCSPYTMKQVRNDIDQQSNRHLWRWLLFSQLLMVFSDLRCQNPVDSITVTPHHAPLLIGKINNFAFTVRMVAAPDAGKISLHQVSLHIDRPELLSKVKIVGLPFVNRWINPSECREQYLTLGSATPDKKLVVEGNLALRKGENLFFVSLIPESGVDLGAKVSVTVEEIVLSNGKVFTPETGKAVFRMASLVRAAGQDNVHTYRIPGLATTNKGTLIAVYDIRYNNDRDLQEDIDVGMSRSTDGGQTWEPMRVIIDMGEYGGLPDSRNGAGDPSVLVDSETNTVWVAALWVHGNYSSIQNNLFSQQGLDPGPDGSGSQLILVKSEDDGISWSDPINITKQTKNPAWGRFLQGPGRGITLHDRTLVFPAQYLDPQRKNGSCSNIIYSRDHGKTWQSSVSSVHNGSEAQVAELSDGRIMINMRTDLKARLVSTSDNLGKTWETHPTSATVLTEPGCQASLISADIILNGEKKRILFFSNPDHPSQRSNMTIKASLDDGLTWPIEYQVKINEETGYGYSCLTMVDQDNLGILYEGNKELFFQKIAVADVLEGLILK
jgi:sialidase-1